MTNTTLGTGRIADLIRYLKTTHNVNDIQVLRPEQKLAILCQSLQFTSAQLDTLIALNSPVLRTVKGHTFEVVFEYILTKNGYKVEVAGGDTNRDLIVNEKLLQLKTPYEAGTKSAIVAYKSHKTHGAKSEREGEDYYADVSLFPDYLVGLISYTPFQVIFIDRTTLPVHPRFPNRLLSPFSLTWQGHTGLNAFNLIGVDTLTVPTDDLKPHEQTERLPITSKLIGVKTDFILNAIMRESNFRIWDMTIRGFAREFYFVGFLDSHNIAQFKPIECRHERADKADFALRHQESTSYTFFQMKGLSVGRCTFSGQNSMVAVETQLTRGRYNDHPTQSRLYLPTDFDYVVFAVDPIVAQKYNTELGSPTDLHWELYAIPTEVLARYPKIQSRISPIQLFKYTELQQYRIDNKWAQQWIKQPL